MTPLRTLSLAALLLSAAPLTLSAQAGPGTPPMPPNTPGVHGMDRGPRGGGEEGIMRIVPPGMWWKNSQVVSTLALTPDQTKRMDDTFLQFRIQLIHMHASLEEEQLKLEPILNANPPDQSRALAQISHIADLRADLEKADAKMLLSLRSVLSADQWTKLQAMGPRGHRGAEGRGPGAGPDGPGADRRGSNHRGFDASPRGRRSDPTAPGQPTPPPAPGQDQDQDQL